MGKGAVERGLEGLFQKKSPKGGAETSPPQGQQPSESQEKKKESPKNEILRELQKRFGK